MSEWTRKAKLSMRSNLLRFELNPLLLREVRARWRKWPTFAIVFGYAILLAVAIGWMFIDVASGNARDAGSEGRTALLGHQLFEKVSWLQVLGWMVLSPVLAAPAFAGEREQGLLDGLYLSGLTPREILRGKLMSVLWFIGLMLLVPLPVIALCFQMGGVSPQEFFLVALLNATTALVGVAIGLHDSANAPTTGAAMRAIFYHLGLWLGSTIFCCIGIFVSPIIALSSLLDDGSVVASIGWVVFTMLCQCAMAIYLFDLTKKALLKPLSEGERSNHGYIAPATPAYQVPLKEVAGMVTAPTVWSEPGDIRLYGENFFFSRLRVGNTLMQFELSRRLRIRTSVMADLYNAIVILTLCYTLWIFAVLVLSSNAKTPLLAIWNVGTTIILALGVLGSAVMGSTTFSRDREQHMLEPILLSPLTNASVIRAKLGAILIVCVAHSVVILPAILPCIRSVSNTSSVGAGISLVQATVAALIIMLSITGAALLGMSVSWLCRRTFVATGWTLALVFLMSVWSTLVSPPTGPAAQNAMSHWHPFYALLAVAGTGRPGRVQLLPGVVCIAVLAFVSAVLLVFLFWAMRNRARIRDKARQRTSEITAVA